MWRTWVGVVSLMRVPDEGGDWRVPDTSAKAENQFIFSAGGKVRGVSPIFGEWWSFGVLKRSPEGADARCWVKVALIFGMTTDVDPLRTSNWS